jgi:hypothetical protein
LCRRNFPPSYADSLEHSVVILLDDAYKDQAHSVSPFDEEAAAVLCLISNHHRRRPPQKKTLCCCKHLLPMPNNARHYSKPRQRKKTKQNKTNTPTNKTTPPVPNPRPTRALLLVHQLRATAQQQKRNPTTPKLLQQKGLKTQEKSLETKRKYQLPKLITQKKKRLQISELPALQSTTPTTTKRGGRPM